MPSFRLQLARLTLVALVAFILRPAAPAAEKPPWWGFQPVRKPAVPSATFEQAGSVSHPIDRFIHAKLAEQGFRPSPEADPLTLIRRLSFDLIGLPPTPEAVEAFEREMKSSPRNRQAGPDDPYTRLVDRLLASPRHGERWARHWLDVVHFGETHGYDKDKLRPHAWPYRDYVIRAFNEDKPYSRFVEEQLAGDVLHPDEPDGIVALGFIAAGPWDYVGHVELPITKTDGLIARYNDRDDMVMTTFSTFQSLTVHCARCHDHKFDPISAREYYALQAVFAGVDRANRPYDPDPQVHRRRQALLGERKALEARQAAIKKSLASITSAELRELDAQIATLGVALEDKASRTGEKKSPSNGYHSNIESGPDATKWVQVDLGRSVSLDEVRLVPARPTDFPDTPGFGFPARFKVEASTEVEFATPLTLADHTAADFKNPGDKPVICTNDAKAGVRFIRVTTTRLWERTGDYVFALGELQAFAGGTNVARGASVTALDSIEAGRWSKKNLVDGYSSRERIEDISLAPEQLAAQRKARGDLEQLQARRRQVFDALVPVAVREEQAQVGSRLAELAKEIAALPEPRQVYAAASEFKAEGSFTPPKGLRPVHFLPRGDVKRPQELMQPAALACIPGPEAKFALPPDHSEGERRAALARWLTDPRNLQTRRSIVNRVWQYHFGRGLVDTPNDFGHMGSQPSHPELLDWLAHWFLENGESLKKLHRLIVTSATYRQASRTDDSASRARGERKSQTLNPAEQADADNRYLWRQNRVRLDAECIRDAMLFVSGQIDLTMGGPSDRQFFFKDDHSPVYDYTRFEVDSKEGRRRSIYRHIVRSVTDPFMDCLDAADPSQLVARRNTTLTALQALATLNNPFVLKQCEHFAARLEELAPEVPAQIEAAYRLALGRPPTAEERERLAAYARRHGLANACRVLFNSTEFMFVD